MSPELDRKLFETFPNLYRQRYLSMQETRMCWGFEHGNGWFEIVWDLSNKLEAMILALPEEARGPYSASQVKEKFGTLRFYMSSETDEMSDAIREAEEQSAVTCETCGNPGTSGGSEWLRTACVLHR